MGDRTPLPQTYAAFDSARGEEMDGVWAFSLSWSLMMRDVAVTLVDEGLREALEVVRATQEAPEDLFGTPREHADSLYAQWSAEGRLVLDDHATSWRDGWVAGLVLSAVFAAMVAGLLLVRGELGSGAVVRLLGISLAVGIGSSLGHTAWTRRHRRPAPGPDVPDDARWSIELTEVLRSRHSMSGARVRVIVAEAHAHAAEAGRTVREEFGTPEQYAARFAPDLRRRSRFTVALFGVLVGSAVVQMVDGIHWLQLVLAVALAWIGWREVRALRRPAPR